MTYRVIYSEGFHRNVEAHVDYLLASGAAPHVIAAWYDRLYTLLDRLNDWPNRYPVDELETRRTGRETRKANFGDYIVFYEVDNGRRCIDVAVFIHGAARG